jgi:dihydrofolate synthase/folylpolyglutamate synthase
MSDRFFYWRAFRVDGVSQEILPGLDRVEAVARRLSLSFTCPVITVGGTNGKGSCCAYLESMLSHAGHRVGCYTSPHLAVFNERIRLAGRMVSDDQLATAFKAVAAAMEPRELTVFELDTLAALWLFAHIGVDVLVLEVGMGGRLDAVNIIDADVAVVTNVAMDHANWLGEDREAIGREKAGIFRPGRPALCGDPDPPRSLIEHAREIGADLYLAGVDFTWSRVEHDRGNSDQVATRPDQSSLAGGCLLGEGCRSIAYDEHGCTPFSNPPSPGTCSEVSWDLYCRGRHYASLPPPAMPGDFQYANASLVLTALDCLEDRLPCARPALERGLRETRLAGRLQVLPGAVERILDVAHNPQAAAALADYLRSRPVAGRTIAVVGMLEDKDTAAVAACLDEVVDAWFCGGLDVPRGLAGRILAQRVQSVIPDRVSGAVDVPVAYAQAMDTARPGDRLVVFGSFFTVQAVLETEMTDC